MNELNIFEWAIKQYKENKEKYVYTPPEDSKMPVCCMCQKEASITKLNRSENGEYLNHKDYCRKCYGMDKL